MTMEQVAVADVGMRAVERREGEPHEHVEGDEQRVGVEEGVASNTARLSLAIQIQQRSATA
jgi:hypothetical protein